MEYRLEIEETQLNRRAARLLEEAEQAIKDGNRIKAYELSLQATDVPPSPSTIDYDAILVPEE